MSLHDDKFLTQFMDFEICDEKSAEIINATALKTDFCLLTHTVCLRACIRFFLNLTIINYFLFTAYTSCNYFRALG